MKKFKDFLVEQPNIYTKYASFKGRILVLGYGSVGQAIVPLLLRHLDVNPSSITILEKDDNKHVFKSRHENTGITYVQQEITKYNYKTELAKYVSSGGLIVNCSLNIDAQDLILWCFDNDIMQIDTSLERWDDHHDEDIPNPADRTLYTTHRTIRKALAGFIDAPTCVVTHGANPGYVSHLTKRALLDVAKFKGIKTKVPDSKESWAQLMKKLGVKVVHVAERDTQIIDEPKKKNEFVNTWSCEGFWAEGRAPAEMGWGTHEEKKPSNGATQGWSAYLNQPGVATLIKSWVPSGGQFNGFCVQHSESITLSDYFTTSDQSFRPSVYYVYQPCDAAITSVHEMRGKELNIQNKQRIIKDEITCGIDELGVLLIGDDFSWWHGSQLSIHDARKLIHGESATSVQVASSMLAAIVWMIENPNEGYIEPEQIPFEKILEIADTYWQPLVSVGSNWTPSKDVNSLFYRPYNSNNPCSFTNFKVWS